MKKKLLLSALFIFIFVAIAIGGMLGIDYYMLKDHWTPQVAQQYKAWKEDPVILPKEALDAKPFSKETVAAAEKFRKAYAVLSAKAEATIDAVTTSTKENWNDVIHDPKRPLPLRQMDELTSLTAAYEALVNRPDYQLEACDAGLLWEMGPHSVNPGDTRRFNVPPDFDFSRNSTVSRLLSLYVARLNREGKKAEALAKAEVIVRGSLTNRYSNSYRQMFAMSGCSIGISAWEHVVDQCDDPALLEVTLKKMNDHSSDVRFFPDEKHSMYLEEISGLRWLMRQGYSIPSFQGFKGPELAWQSNVYKARFLRDVVAPGFTSDTEKLNAVYGLIANNIDRAYRMGPRQLPQGLVKSHPLDAAEFLIRHESYRKISFSFTNGLQDFTESPLHGKTITARFGLLRLKTARKLYRLREGREAPGAAALVPKYLPEIPADPFAEKGGAFKFDKKDYSIGLDRADQKMQLTYDPTNGATSGGDIFLNGN